MSIAKRVKKNATAPREFETGDLIKYLTKDELNNFTHNCGVNKKFDLLGAFMQKIRMTFFGIMVDTDTKDLRFCTTSPNHNLAYNAEMLAVAIKLIAKGENVSVEKVLGKIMSSLYESEKLNEDNNTD